jgi:diguanylate cyclase (GGDEF)-like protein
MRGGVRSTTIGNVPGRAYWQRRLEEECTRAERYRRPFAVILITVGADPQNGGAPVSEAVTMLAAESLRRSVRGSDVVCRLAPNRFGVLLVETNEEGALTAKRRLVSNTVRDLQRCLTAGMMPVITAGHAVYTAQHRSPSTLMHGAEAALQHHAAPAW